eukprot:CAMPEP_0194419628 /NCGR_PEP_ID=MMETSP0176-20130528/18790_1 /TAXON_ID=216777 /ORGANISM="Proboscia alata, Strain PI-D3" /LENGTH=53 /DNA_ID=CAMNT_0039226705 /DNA_START=172 /DNA_END=333 /DNA_ORIENTATION=+
MAAVSILPNVAANPTTPDQLAGIRIDPPPSNPTAKGQSWRATATADPPEDPPL